MRLLRKENSKKFISLSQDEILGFGDEFINVNVTKLKKYVYYLIGNFEKFWDKKPDWSMQTASLMCYDDRMFDDFFEMSGAKGQRLNFKVILREGETWVECLWLGLSVELVYCKLI